VEEGICPFFARVTSETFFSDRDSSPDVTLSIKDFLKNKDPSTPFNMADKKHQKDKRKQTWQNGSASGANNTLSASQKEKLKILALKHSKTGKNASNPYSIPLRSSSSHKSASVQLNCVRMMLSNPIPKA